MIWPVGGKKIKVLYERIPYSQELYRCWLKDRSLYRGHAVSHQVTVNNDNTLVIRKWMTTN